MRIGRNGPVVAPPDLVIGEAGDGGYAAFSHLFAGSDTETYGGGSRPRAASVSIVGWGDKMITGNA